MKAFIIYSIVITVLLEFSVLWLINKLEKR